MKRLLLWSLLALAMPTWAQAQTWDTLGWFRSANNRTTVGGGDSTPCWNFHWNLDSSLSYIVAAGDSAVKVYVYADAGDSVGFAIYKWAGGASGAPTTKVRDTCVVVGGAGAHWDSLTLSPKWGLTAGDSLTYAMLFYNDVEVLDYTIWNPAGDDMKVLTTTDGFPASYSTNDFWTGIPNGYVRIGKYGTGSVVPVTVGGNISIGG